MPTAQLRSLRLICEEIKNVPQLAAVRLEKFTIFTAFAGHSGETLSLDIKDLAPESTGCSNLSYLVLTAGTFRAYVIKTVHFTLQFTYRLDIPSHYYTPQKKMNSS